MSSARFAVTFTGKHCTTRGGERDKPFFFSLFMLFKNFKVNRRFAIPMYGKSTTKKQQCGFLNVDFFSYFNGVSFQDV